MWLKAKETVIPQSLPIDEDGIVEGKGDILNEVTVHMLFVIVIIDLHSVVI